MTNFDRAVGLMGASVVAIACASPAMAQTRTYSIPAQSASSGVAALARQSDQQVLISARDAKGKKTREVRGEMTIEQAFAKLLAGSGLTAKRTGAGAWAVVQGGNGQGDSAHHDASQSNAQFVDVPAASASTVVDARTGAALKGALVEIVETGEKTSTGDLGEFRFPGKTGSFNLRVSYLGYPQYEQFVELKNGRATSGVLLSDGSAVGEIVVTAYQSARAQALNQERTADNTSTVISSDLLGQFDGNTISDALRRTPGVAFQVDPTTGDGTNIIVRGMSPEFNTVTLNGVRLPVGDGLGRSPSLGNILADSVSKITVNKTLLASQDGTGTGGLIDIETKGPLDRPARYFNVSSDRGMAGRDFLGEFNASGTASMRFGEGRNFGVSVSAQYRDRRVRGVTLSTQGIQYPRYLPKDANGVPLSNIFGLDPTIQFPFEPDVDDLYQGSIGITGFDKRVRNIALGASAQWSIGSHTDLKLDYNFNRSISSNFSNSVSFAPRTGNRLLPIGELNGEMRYARVWENFAATGLQATVARSVLYHPHLESRTQTIAFNGATNIGPLRFDYKAGYALGRNRNDNPFTLSAATSGTYVNFSRANIDEDAMLGMVNGRLVSPFPASDGRHIMFPGLNQSGFAILNDTSLYRSSQAGIIGVTGLNRRITGRFATTYDFGDRSLLQNISAGVYYEKSTLETGFGSRNSYQFPNASIRDLGLEFSEDFLEPVGVESFVGGVSRRSFLDLYGRLRNGSVPGTVITRYDASSDDSELSTIESTLAGFVEAKIKIGIVDIIGGVRVEKVRTNSGGSRGSSIFLADGTVDQDFYLANPPVNVRASGANINVLPRVQVNLRFTDNLIVRAGFFQTFSRPSVSDLKGDTFFNLDLSPFYGPEGNQPGLGIGLPNPGLKAAVTSNYDLSLEWYSSSIGVIKIGAFYKPTKSPFFSNTSSGLEGLPDGVELPDDPRFSMPGLFIQTYQTRNSDYTTQFWGGDISVERRLDFLPGVFGGLGIYANLTYADGKREIRYPFATAPGGEIVTIRKHSGQPRYSGTFALTYSRNGLDASVSYTAQQRYLTVHQNFGLDNFREAVSSLDVRASYLTKIAGAEARIFLEGSNLLRGPGDPGERSSIGGVAGTPKAMLNANYIGGRVLRGGLSVSF